MNPHNAVVKAIKSGLLTRQTSCEVCESSANVVAHHDDYAKPLEVRWLCRRCHSRWHSAHGRGANANFETETLGLVVPMSMLLELKQLAAVNDRSVSAELRIAIRQHLRLEREKAAA